MITNSSPPKRESVSPGRTARRRRSADDTEQLVAHLVTEVVVDDLEAIDVTEEHGHPTAGAVGLQQRVVEVVEEEAPVGQAGQGVLERVAGQLLLEGLALRGVAEDDDRSRRLRVAHHGGRGHGHREVRTVAALEPGVVGGDVLPQRHGAQGRVEQEARRLDGRRQERPSPDRRRRDQPSMLAPAGFMNVISPLSLIGAHALAEAAGDDRQVVLLPLDLRVEVGVGQGDGADRGQRVEQCAIGVVEGLGPAAARDGQARACGRPARPAQTACCPPVRVAREPA